MTGRNHNLDTLKKRASFVRMNESAGRFVVSNFILQMIADPELAEDEMRVGYTVTKKMGGAVERNRIKRRLREAAKRVMPQHARGGHNYVFIARIGALTCDFAELVREMEFAFSRIKASKKP